MNQCELIMKYLIDFGSITPLEAFIDLGVMRFSARIYDIKKQGTQLKEEYIKITTRYGIKKSVKKFSLI